MKKEAFLVIIPLFAFLLSLLFMSMEEQNEMKIQSCVQSVDIQKALNSGGLTILK